MHHERSHTGRIERGIGHSIFLRIDDMFVLPVQNAYSSMGDAGLPEFEFTTYACQNLFLGRCRLLADDPTRELCAVRSLQWPLKPDRSNGDTWHIPPITL